MKKLILTLLFLSLTSSAHADITTGLIGYWRMDNADISGTTMSDKSGSSNDGTMVNSPTTGVAGHLGEALQLHGTPTFDYVNVANPNSFALPSKTSACTISAWIKTTATDAAIFSVRDTGNTVLDFTLGFNGISNLGTGKPSVLVRDSAGSGLTAVTASGAVNDGNWHHVVATRDTSQNILIYVDKTQTGSGTDSMTTSQVGTACHIGHEPLNATILSFVGIIDEVRYYNRALSSTDVTELYDYTGATTNKGAFFALLN